MLSSASPSVAAPLKTGTITLTWGSAATVIA
jgi:hypothetical protein